jgi:septum formation protein
MTLSQSKLILASASPRRAELLRNAGISFEVEPAEIDESRQEGELPVDYACRLAAEKARAVAAGRPGDFVLGADTVVSVDEKVLGKPNDLADAARMLKLLSGRRHLVTTGVCLIAPDHNFEKDPETRNSKPETFRENSRYETTEVFFRPLSNEEIRWYVRRFALGGKDCGRLFQRGGTARAAGVANARGKWIYISGFELKRRQTRHLRAENYFFSASPSLTPLLKLRIPSPRPLPISASRPGPKIRSAITRMTSNSGIPNLNGIIPPAAKRHATNLDCRPVLQSGQKSRLNGFNEPSQ